MRRLIFLFLMVPLASSPLRAAEGKIFKDFTWTSGAVADDWRVTDPTSPRYDPSDPDPNHRDVEPFLPNPTLNINGVDLQDALSAEAILDFWGGHLGTMDKKFKFNNSASWSSVPDLPTTSNSENYLQQWNPHINVPITGNLQDGNNTFIGTCGNQSGRYAFDWGQWGWYGMVLRMTYNATKSHPTGSITQPSPNSIITDNPTITVSASGTAGIKEVQILAYYEDFDYDGDGIFTQWHESYRKRNGAMQVDHVVGTATTAPYQVTWNTDWVPDQAPGIIKIKARIKDNNGMVYETPAVENITLQRTTRSVQLYKPLNVPPSFWAFESNNLSSQVNIPSSHNLAKAQAARMWVATWNGTNCQGATHWTKVNGWTTPSYGADYLYSLDVIDVPRDTLHNGDNSISFFADTVVLNTQTQLSEHHHGIEILWPGPGMIVQYNYAISPSLQPPTGLMASAASSSQSNLTWNASAGTVTGYNIYRGGRQIATTASLSFQDTGLTSGAYNYQVSAYNSEGESGLSTPASVTIGGTSGTYTLPVTLNSGAYERVDKAVDIDLNFTQKLAAAGKAGLMNAQSLSVSEVDENGAVIDGNVPFQFDPSAAFDAAVKAQGTLVILMKGTTPANTARMYQVHFKTGSSGSGASVTPLVKLTDNVTDEGQSSFKIETPQATYFYQKTGAGFSSLLDKDGQDWLSFNSTPGSHAGGEYRGIPNLGPAFHPGYPGNGMGSTSALISQGPLKATFESVSSDAQWKTRWEIYPKYAKMTLLQSDPTKNYWFLYEGTPGGRMDPVNDFMVRSTGEQTPLSTLWDGDLPNEEWVYFASQGRSLYAIHNIDDNLPESYWPMDNSMTVFGFGRTADTVPKMTAAPNSFIIGLMDTTDYAAGKKIIDSASKDVTYTVGNLPGSVPTMSFEYQIIDPNNKGRIAVGDIDGDGKNDVIVHRWSGGRGESVNGVANGEVSWYHYPDWNKHVIQGERNYFGDEIQAVDLDGDGDIDVIVPEGQEGDHLANILWYENVDGHGTSWIERKIGTISGDGEEMSLHVQDIDRDGKLDIAIRTYSRATLFYQDSKTSWTQKTTVIVPREGSTLGDVDQDGYPDFIFNGYWLKNPGTRQDNWERFNIDPLWYSQPSVSAPLNDDWRDDSVRVQLADLNSDGKKDIVLCHAEHHGFNVAWYESTHPTGGPSAWTKHEIGVVDFAHSLQVADFDGDGSMDIMAASTKWATTGQVNIFLNDGHGNFTRKVIDDKTMYIAVAADIDNDGDMDILSSQSWEDAPVGLWRNKLDPKSRKHTLDNWVYKAVDTNRAPYVVDGPHFFGIYMADATGDGLGDIVSGRYFYRNPGGDMTGTWPRYEFPVNADGALIVDVDHNGLGDVIAFALPDIYWFEANADGSVWTQRRKITLPATTKTYHQNPQGWRLADLDGDGKPEILFEGGDPDIYSSPTDGIYALKIPANPLVDDWPLTRLTSEGGDGIGVGDIDGDGDLDLTIGQHGVKWYENPGSLTPLWTGHDVGEAAWALYEGQMKAVSADRFVIADVDGDGKPDILMSEETWPWPDQFSTHGYWFKNPGNPRSASSWVRNDFTGNGYHGTQSMQAVDMDGDGDIDIVLGEHKADKRMFIFENDGKGNFTPHEIGRGHEAHGLVVADLNGDGQKEIAHIGWDDTTSLHLWINKNQVVGGDGDDDGDNSATDDSSPSVPSKFTATAASSSQINLSWTASSDNVAVTGYRIMRGGVFLANTTATSYQDKSLPPLTIYNYQVAAYDAAQNTSALTAMVSARTLAVPLESPQLVVGLASGLAGTEVDLTISLIPGTTGASAVQFDLTFPASLSFVSAATESAAAAAGKDVYSAAISGGARFILFGNNQNAMGSGVLATVRLRIAPAAAEGPVPVSLGNLLVSDPGAAPVPAIGVNGQVTVSGSAENPPEDPDLGLLDGKTFPVNAEIGFTYHGNASAFNWEVTPQSAAQSSGLRAQKAGMGVAGAASFATRAPRFSLASLNLQPGSYMLRVQAVRGSLSSGWKTATIFLSNVDLAAVQVYPNPWRSDRHAGKDLYFGSLPAAATVKIFTVSGHHVKTLDAAVSGTAPWNLTTDSGDKAASGIYLYLITTPDGGKKRGKLTIIR